ncbi:MAG TPA: hypothetical protein VMC10_07060 [Stellaceae bacterium]|nr:hypothetical protein [Stellaceae bacterium]
MIGNNVANNAASGLSGGKQGTVAPPSAPPGSAAVIDLASRKQPRKLTIRAHWGLLFAVCASLVLWLVIWACARLFF